MSALFSKHGTVSSGVPGSVLCILIAAASAVAQHSAVITLPDSIMEPGTRVTWLKKEPRYCEGPATDGGTLVYFTEQHANSDPNWPIWKLDLGNPGDTGNICNCHFGGPDNKTLFCTGDGGLFSIRLKIPGRAWPAASTTGIVAMPRLARKAPGKSGTHRIDGRYRLDATRTGGQGRWTRIRWALPAERP